MTTIRLTRRGRLVMNVAGLLTVIVFGGLMGLIVILWLAEGWIEGGAL